ncbi:Membrane bound O-acyl transferase MBOAT [Carpediemonas membranifera]|uniref:Membrane bound O-acyl transferase MBOAT n=1 Tax=Carpediemonas membranifera TaxID=201153 RepID=A0A8J6AZY5_9EUKA|nr:Membrane bound O-acyl transferase MBOAT [Carpediemonas membranifera]|eukprot:KAG9390002.1 Membrane bound O-acyl transferase MBOAT [Carpediemonas membranifera]
MDTISASLGNVFDLALNSSFNLLSLYGRWIDHWCYSPSLINDTVSDFAATIGVSPYDVRMFASLLIAFIFAFFHQLLPWKTPTIHHIYNLVAGVFLTILAFGPKVLNVYIMITTVYVLLRLNPRRLGLSPSFMSWLIFLLTFGYQSWEQARRIYHPHSMENVHFTSMPMILALRLSSLAFDVARGSEMTAEELSEKPKPIGPFGRLKTPLARCPELLQYLGYSMFYGSVIVGPFFTFTEYSEVTSGRATEGMAKPDRRRLRIESIVWGVIYLGWSCVLMSFWVLFSFFPPDPMLPYHAQHATYLATPLLWRIVRYHIIPIELIKAKYYAVWGLAHGASTMSGLTYSGRRHTMARVWSKFEFRQGANYTWLITQFPPNLALMTTHWNAGIGFFLASYVYSGVRRNELISRRLGKNVKLVATIATFVTSAIWHGWEPGYYLFFLAAGFFTSLARRISGILRPFFVSRGRLAYVYHVFTTLSTMGFMYLEMPVFYFLSWERCMGYFQAVHYLPFVILGGGFALSAVIPPLPARKNWAEGKKMD